MTERPPYDEDDAGRVRRYLESRGRRLVDPLGADCHPNDPYFAPSLACARRQMLEAFGATRPDGTRFRAYPAFIESHRPNAFAVDLGGGLHLCGINTGMVTSLFELAAFTFSQADLFPEVGNPAVEESPRLPADSLLAYWIADRVIAVQPTQATAVGEELIPRDPERRLMAHFLTQVMLRFVWFHELFHGLNGHSGYVAGLWSGAELREMPDEAELAVVEVDADLLAGLSLHKLGQALEFDADRAAYRTTIKLQYAGNEPFALFAEHPLYIRLKVTYYATALMTFLFDQSAKRRKRPSNTHPAGQQRLHMIMGANTNKLRSISGNASRSFECIVIEINSLLMKLYNANTNCLTDEIVEKNVEKIQQNYDYYFRMMPHFMRRFRFSNDLKISQSGLASG